MHSRSFNGNREKLGRITIVTNAGISDNKSVTLYAVCDHFVWYMLSHPGGDLGRNEENCSREKRKATSTGRSQMGELWEVQVARRAKLARAGKSATQLRHVLNFK